jgi:hypothetical protein
MMFSPEQQKSVWGISHTLLIARFAWTTSGQTEYPPHRSMWSATHTHSSDGEVRQDVTNAVANHNALPELIEMRLTCL